MSRHTTLGPPIRSRSPLPWRFGDATEISSCSASAIILRWQLARRLIVGAKSATIYTKINRYDH